MAAPVVERSTGDVIPASDHNDVKDYIEDGTYRINTLSLNIQGVGEIITTAGELTNISGDITQFDSGTLVVGRGGTGKTVWTQYLVVYADTTSSLSQIAIGSDGQVLTSNGAGSAPSFQAATGGDLDTLGTIIMHNPTISGAKSLADMRALGWAVCDGTSPAAQGIGSPTITTTDDMTDKFIRGHATTAGGTGGSDTHTLSVGELAAHTHSLTVQASHDDTGDAGDKVITDNNDNATQNLHANSIANTTGSNTAHNNMPAYFVIVFMIKVKII